ncbi:MAG: hypothetical protein IJJ47_07075 [Methanosphaera sp.]|nr:hypothetical protein [Methanosphaera sp.]
MFEIIKRNKVRTLEPKKDFIVNDINIKEYDLNAVLTIVAVSILFLLSLKIIIIAGTI